MNVNILENIVSASRLHNYIISQGPEPGRAIALYEQNIALSQSFYPLLSILEVALRNAIDKKCIHHFSDSNWLVNQKAGFMSDSRLTYILNSGTARTNDFLKRSVEDAEKKIVKRHKQMTHGNIIAELTFGFWTEFFEPTHYALLKGVPIQAFPHLPPSVRRNNLYTALNEIRRFRNRIYHNEPICFHYIACDRREAVKIRRMIFEMLGWLSFDLPAWIGTIDGNAFELLLTDRYCRPSISLRKRSREFISKLSASMRILRR